jgi:hypothetical protein
LRATLGFERFDGDNYVFRRNSSLDAAISVANQRIGVARVLQENGELQAPGFRMLPSHLETVAEQQRRSNQLLTEHQDTLRRMATASQVQTDRLRQAHGTIATEISRIDGAMVQASGQTDVIRRKLTQVEADLARSRQEANASVAPKLKEREDLLKNQPKKFAPFPFHGDYDSSLIDDWNSSLFMAYINATDNFSGIDDRYHRVTREPIPMQPVFYDAMKRQNDAYHAHNAEVQKKYDDKLKALEDEITRLKGANERELSELERRRGESNAQLDQNRRTTTDLELRRNAQMEALARMSANWESHFANQEADFRRAFQKYENDVHTIAADVDDPNKPWQFSKGPNWREHLERLVHKVGRLPEVLRLEVGSDLTNVLKYLSQSRSSIGLEGSEAGLNRLGPLASIDRVIKFSKIPMETHMNRLIEASGGPAALEAPERILALEPVVSSDLAAPLATDVLSRMPQNALERLNIPVMPATYERAYARQELLESSQQLLQKATELTSKPTPVSRALASFFQNMPNRDGNTENIFQTLNTKHSLEDNIGSIKSNMKEVTKQAAAAREELQITYDSYRRQVEDANYNISNSGYPGFMTKKPKREMQNAYDKLNTQYNDALGDIGRQERAQMGQLQSAMDNGAKELTEYNRALEPVIKEHYSGNRDFHRYLTENNINVSDFKNIRPVTEKHEKKLLEEGYDFSTFRALWRQMDARKFADTFPDYRPNDRWYEVDEEGLGPRLDLNKEAITYDSKGNRLPVGSPGFYSNYQQNFLHVLQEREPEFTENVRVGHMTEGGGPMRVSSPIPEIVLDREAFPMQAHIQARDVLKAERITPGTLDVIRSVATRVHPQEGVDITVNDQNQLTKLEQIRDDYNEKIKVTDRMELERLNNVGRMFKIGEKAVRDVLTRRKGAPNISLEVTREDVAEAIIGRRRAAETSQSLAMTESGFRPVLMADDSGRFRIPSEVLEGVNRRLPVSYLGVINPLGPPILVSHIRRALPAPENVNALVANGILEVKPVAVQETPEPLSAEPSHKPKRWPKSLINALRKERFSGQVQYPQEDFFANILMPRW